MLNSTLRLSFAKQNKTHSGFSANHKCVKQDMLRLFPDSGPSGGGPSVAAAFFIFRLSGVLAGAIPRSE